MLNDIQELRTLGRSEREHDGVNVAECLDTLAHGKSIIVSALLSVMVLAGLYVLLAPPLYQADALLRVDKNQAFLNDPLRGETPPATGEAENPRAQREVEILRSRSVLGKVVADLELATKVSPKYFPLIGEALARWHDNRERLASPWWGFERYAWGGETIKVTNLRVPDRYLGKELTLL
jgi:tyrosine-protein kinase Etk/Wzc